MFDAYFMNLENSLNMLIRDKNNDKNELEKIKEDLFILRRDLNDIHSIVMLRDAAKKIKKENLIAFIGIGGLSENPIHAFIYCKLLQRQGEIDVGIEIIFIAQTQIEYDLLLSYGFDGVYIWQYQSSVAKKLLQARTVVVSTHLFSEWGGRCLLSACVSNANVIQLWHGLPAKVIGMAGLADRVDFHFFARMLNDVANTNYVFIENNLSNTKQVYEATYPGCVLEATGSIRLHILFDKIYREKFLQYKNSRLVSEWVEENKDGYRVLYCPTYREQIELQPEFFERIKSVLGHKNDVFAVALKLHIGVNFSQEQMSELTRLASQNGHLVVDSLDEVYSSFPDFDAIITDYSSIRMDFAVLGKPVFLYQFDKDTYSRETDVIELFSELDRVSYYLNDFSELAQILQADEKKIEREAFVNHRLRGMLYDDSANKVVNTILKIHNQD